MSTDQLVTLVVTVAGVAMGLGYYPQAYRLWRTKSSRDVSLGTYGIFGAGTTIWFAYGLYKPDPIIMWSFLPGFVGSWLVVTLTLYYRNTKKGPYPG